MQFIIVLPIMSRLLPPEDFGIIAMATTLVLFFMIFNDFGIGSALIQHENPDEALWSSAMWTNAGLGVFLAILAYAGSGFVADLFREPRTEPVIQAMAVILVIHCLAIIPSAWLRRHYKFKAIAIIELAAHVLGAAVSISLAFNGAGVWSLVWGQLVLHTARALGMWQQNAAPIRFMYRVDAIKKIMGFSANLMAANLTGYVSRNADNFLIGRYLDASTLGLYTRAYQIMLMPNQLILQGANTALFPALSELQKDPRRAGEAYLGGVKIIALVAFPMMLGVSALAAPLTLLAFGPAWSGAAPLIAVLAPIGALQAITSTRGALFMAIARTDILLYWAFFASSVAVGSFIFGLQWGAIGVATAYLVASVAMFTPAMQVLLRLVGLSVIDLYRRIWPSLTSALIMYLIVFSLNRELAAQDVSTLAKLALCVPVGIITYGALIWVMDRKSLLELFNLGRAIFKRGAGQTAASS